MRTQMVGQHAILTHRCETCVSVFRSARQKGQIQNKRHQGWEKGNGPIEYAQQADYVSYLLIIIFFEMR